MKVKIWRQYMVPQHLLSRLMGWFTTRTTSWLVRWQINTFIKVYQVDLSEAIHKNPQDYVTFTHFFTRHLKVGARKVSGGKADIVSPADGQIAQIGQVEGMQMIQAKHHQFTVDDLLGGDKVLAQPFHGGLFTTIYLGPPDYHRVHMPLTGKLIKMIYIPGRLFSVNLLTAEHVPQLFARNERVVCLFETDAGPMAMVLVGAMLVASICTHWAGVVTPQGERGMVIHDYEDRPPIILNRGEEMGYFNFGSTVILLFSKEAATWLTTCQPGDRLQVGQPLGVAVNS